METTSIVNKYSLTENQYNVARLLKDKDVEMTKREITIYLFGKTYVASVMNALLKLLSLELIKKIERGCQPDRFVWTGPDDFFS